VVVAVESTNANRKLPEPVNGEPPEDTRPEYSRTNGTAAFKNEEKRNASATSKNRGFNRNINSSYPKSSKLQQSQDFGINDF
jgi:hypothetical protein